MRLRARACVLALSAALVVTVGSVALACIWDDDTLRAETEGLPGIEQVIAGRFARYPAAYYERRLEIAGERIARDRDDLGAYDNAGVAGDRLGRGDAAIEWMSRKRARLDALGPEATDAEQPLLDEHRYRLLANLGTFHAHRWVRSGASRDDVTDLDTAARLLTEAIRLNPDAHFGRERYQLRAIEWLRDVEPWGTDERGRPQRLGDFLGLQGTSAEYQETGRQRVLEEKGIADAVKGLEGLIVLGNAWESVDVFHALALALQAEGRSSVAFLARLRMEELVSAGRGSLRPQAPTGDTLLEVTFGPSLLRDERQRDLRKHFASLRAEARTYREAFSAKVESLLAEGRHPDTDPTFHDALPR